MCNVWGDNSLSHWYMYCHKFMAVSSYSLRLGAHTHPTQPQECEYRKMWNEGLGNRLGPKCTCSIFLVCTLYTVKPLLKDTPEIRSPLGTGHFTRSPRCPQKRGSTVYLNGCVAIQNYWILDEYIYFVFR